MSELKVNKISPQSGTAFTLGDSGDTFTVPSGATLTVSGTLTQTGAQTFDGGVEIDNFTINGSEIDLSSGDMTLDVAGDIILDADGGEVLFHDATTAMGHISMASSNITLKSLVSDKDIIFQGNDGGAGITALTLDMSAAGAATFNNNVTVGDNLNMTTDSSVIAFGADSEITLTHSADSGLILKHTATADDKPVSLTLQTGETDMAANDVIGKIDFQAPDEATGTDAILVAAGIEAISEGDFSSSANATKLSFKTAASEAAAEKMSLSSAGLLTVANGLTLSDGDVTVASGHGISFAATGDGSSTMINELLDDYEEGTWTPTFGNYGGTDQTASGEYTKIGELIIAGGRIGTDGSSDSSVVQIAGLPYTISNSPAINGHGGLLINFTTSSQAMRAQTVNNTSYVEFSDASGNSVNYNDFGANKEIRFTIIYKVA